MNELSQRIQDSEASIGEKVMLFETIARAAGGLANSEPETSQLDTTLTF